MQSIPGYWMLSVNSTAFLLLVCVSLKWPTTCRIIIELIYNLVPYTGLHENVRFRSSIVRFRYTGNDELVSGRFKGIRCCRERSGLAAGGEIAFYPTGHQTKKIKYRPSILIHPINRSPYLPLQLFKKPLIKNSNCSSFN